MLQRETDLNFKSNCRWIDVHCHLDMLSITPDEALERAQKVGIERIITIGTSPDDHEQVFSLSQKLGSRVYCTLGVHPHEAQKYTREVEQYLAQKTQNEKVVAIGEIGLDYYYDNAPREEQQKAFRSQLQLALELDLPVEIHTRDAEEDTLAILKEFGGKIKGLIHCFTGTQGLAEEGLKLGLDLSFSGVITFKNAQNLRDICQKIPLERLHVETDAPFLAPVPERGKKNEPAFMLHTAREIAKIKQVSLEDLAQKTQINAQRLFTKLKWLS